MGDHYVPQFYLKGFADSSDRVWVYRKGHTSPFQTHIWNIAQENRLYSKDIEQYLANDVEEPANQVLRKIRNREQITCDEKLALSRYMIALLKRVPAHREWVEEKFPKVLDTIFSRVENRLDELAMTSPLKADVISHHRSELAKIRNDPEMQNMMMADTWLSNISPERTQQSLDALSSMTWGFFVAKNGQYFIANDNPVFYFRWMGIGNEKSEVTFPLAMDIVLWATWRKDVRDDYYPASSQIVREINRRTSSNSTHFLYSPYSDDWIQLFANKRRFKLNRIV